MCRLFAVRASNPSQVHLPLVLETNALRHQSREHPDGWGIAFYAGGQPRIVRGVEAAFEDANFEAACQSVSSETVLAHVRKASVGPLTLENTHPFEFGPWLMAHNGTIPEFAKVQAEIEALIAPHLREKLSGDTDSERVFFLLLTRLEARTDLLCPKASLDDVLGAMEETVRLVMHASSAHELHPSLNLVLTNGNLLAAFRHGRTLFFSNQNRFGEQLAAVEQWPVSPAIAGETVSHLIVSSERIGHHALWNEVPEDEFVAVDERMRLVRRSVSLSDSIRLSAPVA
jgi:glutamine amidotransferase